LACGLSCSHPDPQASFHHAQELLRHGDLTKAQAEAEQGYRRSQTASPVWAAKFKNLEAEALLLRGMYPQALALLDSGPTPPDTESDVKRLALTAAAQSRTQDFYRAEQTIRQAEAMCVSSSVSSCGDVPGVHGVFYLQKRQPDVAESYFEKTLNFARLQDNQFLEATAFLNLGLAAQQQQHYDEAMDRTDAAYRMAVALNARTIATKAQGNLGWAYFNLGDSERSLELSQEAEQRAIQAGDIIDQLSWITNMGYVYDQLHDLSRAKQSYLKSLDFARETHGRDDIYKGLRALALVSVESGELEDARKYSDEAYSLAQNRADQLYLVFVRGLIAGQSHQPADAERIFREVEEDKDCIPDLKWRAEHELANIFETQNRPDFAAAEYRTAVATFEGARSSLKDSELRLPFSSNASSIYDDYVHFLVAHGKSDDALRWADYSRARTLSEGFGVATTAANGSVERKTLPEAPTLQEKTIAARAKATILYYWLGEKESYLWVITPRESKRLTLPVGRRELDAQVQRYDKALAGPVDVMQFGNEDGRALYRTLVAPAQSLLPKDARVFIVPDGSLNNLNFETLIAPDPKPHFWIDDATITVASSLRLLNVSLRSQEGKSEHRLERRRLLLIGNSIAPNDQYPALPNAQAQMESVARHFTNARRQIFSGAAATPASYPDSHPEQFSHIHFVAHGIASRLSPLDSAIVLSRNPGEADSFKLYAREILRHPLHADLVTISACYGAGERAYSGEGLVGLAWAFLRAGSHNVIAGLWAVTDASTEQMMDRFYDELDKGEGPDVALRNAKLTLLHGNAFRSPFYWAPFQLYAGS
jgi:CHAT domain-containing protein/Tfp pilus assembly protein PilF